MKKTKEKINVIASEKCGLLDIKSVEVLNSSKLFYDIEINNHLLNLKSKKECTIIAEDNGQPHNVRIAFNPVSDRQEEVFIDSSKNPDFDHSEEWKRNIENTFSNNVGFIQVANGWITGCLFIEILWSIPILHQMRIKVANNDPIVISNPSQLQECIDIMLKENDKENRDVEVVSKLSQLALLSKEEKERTFINIQNSNDDFVNITHYFLLNNMFPFRVNFKHHTIVIGEDYVFNTKDVYAAIKDIKGNVLS
jgi:hypothetical protein